METRELIGRMMMPSGIDVNSHRRCQLAEVYDPNVAESTKAPLDAWRERLEEARKARGISGNEVVRRMVPQPKPGAYSRWQSGARGKRISAEMHAALAKALGVHEHWLRTGEGPRDLDNVEPTKIELVLRGLPASDANVREAAAMYLKLYPDADVDDVRAWVIEEEQRIVREAAELRAKMYGGAMKRLAAQHKKATDQGETPKSAREPKSKRQTGTE